MAITLANMTENDFVHIENSKLRDYTRHIVDYAYNMRANALRIAATMAIILENKDELLAEFDGSFEMFGEKILGLKKSQSFAYAQVGREFLDQNGMAKLYQPDESSYTMTQLQALLPLKFDGAQALAIEGEITPEMTVKEIKDVVKSHDPKAKEKTARSQKRAEKVEQREAARAKVDEQMHGKIVATIVLRFKEDTGEYIVKLNDKDVTKTNLGRYIVKNCK